MPGISGVLHCGQPAPQGEETPMVGNPVKQPWAPRTSTHHTDSHRLGQLKGKRAGWGPGEDIAKHHYNTTTSRDPTPCCNVHER